MKAHQNASLFRSFEITLSVGHHSFYNNRHDEAPYF